MVYPYPSISYIINPMYIPVIARQLTILAKQPIDGVRIIFSDNDVLDIQADIKGPVSTPFEGGEFRCKLIIPPNFPQIAPKGFFLTKIFHPNVSEKGEICVNTLKKDWNPNQWSLKNIFEVIKCLLIVPFPESSLNEEAGKLFMENYDEYFRHAKIFSDLYARKEEDQPLKQVLNGSNQQFDDGNSNQSIKKTPITQPSKKENEQKKWLKRI